MSYNSDLFLITSSTWKAALPPHHCPSNHRGGRGVAAILGSLTAAAVGAVLHLPPVRALARRLAAHAPIHLHDASVGPLHKNLDDGLPEGFDGLLGVFGVDPGSSLDEGCGRGEFRTKLRRCGRVRRKDERRVVN